MARWRSRLGGFAAFLALALLGTWGLLLSAPTRLRDVRPSETPENVAMAYIYFADPLSGLGNKLFQYASARGMALRYAKSSCLVMNDPFLRSVYSGMKAAFAMSELPRVDSVPAGVEDIYEAGWAKYDRRRFDDPAQLNGSYRLLGTLQSWRYFQPVADEIRKELRLTEKYESAVAAYFSSRGLAWPESLLVGVHVRRGDMVRKPRLYTTASADYIARAVGYYRAKYGAKHNLTFVVATDDRPWVESVFSSGRLSSDLRVVYTGLQPTMDMAVLSKCNHTVITGGTFGWWAGWLAGGHVVYYRDFINPSSELYGGYSESDYYPPTWIGLS